MRILIIGAAGTIGRAVTAALAPRHEILRAGRASGEITVDVKDPASIKAMFEQAGALDAVVVAAGGGHMGPFSETTSQQFRAGLDDKLMGQVNVVLVGQHYLKEGGSFTLTSGIVAQHPIDQGTNLTTINRAVEGFAQSAAAELKRRLRINVVSPTMLTESQEVYGPYFPGYDAVPAERVARAYQRSVEGIENGQVLRVW